MMNTHKNPQTLGADILNLPVMGEFIRTAGDIYAHGWAERNGGNISMLLDFGLPHAEPQRVYPLDVCENALDGKLIIITGSGKYLKNIGRSPSENTGVFRINGANAELLWGLEGGGNPSSEFSSHLQCHAVRLKADENHRVVMHTHATNLTAMTFVHPLDEREFTKTLWSMMTECLMFFPDGISVLPWMVCGTGDIGRATADKMLNNRVVVWAHHGVFSAGSTPDEALGLIEVAEKAAELYVKTAHLKALSKITEPQLLELASALGLKPREGYLNG